MLSFAESQERLAALDAGVRSSRTETVPLASALGRFLSEDIAIDQDQPGFDRATMDGFAVVPDGGATFNVVGTLLAGQVYEGELSPGSGVRIMTGAPAPSGTTVVPIENAEGFTEGDAAVTLVGPPEPRKNIAWRGEDAREGDVLVARGTRLAPSHLSVAAMAGANKVDVFQRPRISVVTTGDEVGSEGAAGVRDSNGPLLDGLMAAIGAIVERRHARDDADALEGALRGAAESADVVVTTGGVSMGTHDLVPQTLSALGFVTVFHRVQVQPGKPVLVAQRPDGSLFVGLPGNPVSVLATAHLFLLPAIGSLLGGWCPASLELPMAEDWVHRGKRHLFLPARVENGGISPMRWNGSGDLIAAAAADGLVEFTAGADLRAGDPVRFIPYVGHALQERAVLPDRTR